MAISFTNYHGIVTPAKRGVKYTFDRDTTPCPPMKRARLQSQSSMSTLNSENTESPPALEYADSPERDPKDTGKF